MVPGPVSMQEALGSHPPLFTEQLLMATQTEPLPEYPAGQVQVLVPGPVERQTATGSQPPLLTEQLLIAVQDWPLPA